MIQDLPQSIVISEDTTDEALLYTMVATDSADDFTCAFTANVLGAWPFIMRQIPATTSKCLLVL